MISILIRSLSDRTRDSQTLNCDWPRIGFEPPTRAKAERQRSVLPSPVDRYCLHLAHHPGRTDDGSRSELTRPRRASTLGSRLDPPAARPAGRMRGLRHQHVITLHVATLQNGRLPPRIPVEACHSKLLQHRYQRAAVGASRRRVHRPTALWSALDAADEVLSSSTLSDQEGVRERAHDVGSVGTDARASAIMLTSGFCANWRS